MLSNHRRMRKLFLTMGAVFVFFPLSFTEDAQPVSAPTDVVLRLETVGDEHQFHLGELIPVRFSYAANPPGQYVWVSQSKKLAGGHPLEISCSPSAHLVSTPQISIDDTTFGQMLEAPCGGVGGGMGGGCSDCGGEYPLTSTALTFGVVPLNTYVRFSTPGIYTCEASSADITSADPGEKIRPALLVKSNPVVLTIADDPQWSHYAALAYANTYEKFCRGDDVAERRFSQCSDVAQRITYLDTADSLATEVKWFDGRNHGWESGFWEAIQHSSHLENGLRLMSSRMQERDFEVSTDVLEWLAGSELRLETPDAFKTSPANYHAQAVDKLRKYVRMLGTSLSEKDSKVRVGSVKTYRMLAEQRYCEAQSLIPTEEQIQVLAAAGVQP